MEERVDRCTRCTSRNYLIYQPNDEYGDLYVCKCCGKGYTYDSLPTVSEYLEYLDSKTVKINK